jgi:hypothetical protein
VKKNEEKMHFIPHMLAYVGIFLWIRREKYIKKLIIDSDGK